MMEICSGEKKQIWPYHLIVYILVEDSDNNKMISQYVYVYRL